MNKREFLEKIAHLKDDEEVMIAIVYDKSEEDEGFEAGTEGSAPDDDEDDGSLIDNGDGTMTQLHAIEDIEILENEDPDNNNAKENFAAIVVDLGSDDGDEEDDDDDSGEQDPQATAS